MWDLPILRRRVNDLGTGRNASGCFNEVSWCIRQDLYLPAGLRSEKNLTRTSPITRQPSAWVTSPWKVPCTESCLNWYAAYSKSKKGSLTATTVASGFSRAARITKRPIRPNPLMPIAVTMLKVDKVWSWVVTTSRKIVIVRLSKCQGENPERNWRIGCNVAITTHVNASSSMMRSTSYLCITVLDGCSSNGSVKKTKPSKRTSRTSKIQEDPASQQRTIKIPEIAEDKRFLLKHMRRSFIIDTFSPTPNILD